MNSEEAKSATGFLYERISKRQHRIILFAVALGTFMGPLDGSVVNIALPTISSDYKVTLATVEWVVMSYLLMTSSLLLTFGRLGDLYGHKNIYLRGFIVFTFGSLLCGVAPSILMLIIFRGVQAIGAGMMMSMGPAIVADITDPRERGRSLGVIAVAVSVALTTGPVLGGFLTSYFGWRSVFFINIPIGIAGSFLAYKVIPVQKSNGVQPFDIPGSVMFFLALVSMLFSLSNAEKMGWNNPVIIGLLAGGIILLFIFIFFESRTPYPMLDTRLFKNRLFSMGNLSALMSFIAMNAVILIMPFYLQQVLNLSPSQAGFYLIPMPLVTMIVAPVSGIISDRTDTRYVSSLGMAIMATGLFLLSRLKGDSDAASIVTALVLLGLGSGMFQTPNNSAVLGTVLPNRRGIASSMLAVMRNTGMVLGIAVSGAIFSTKFSSLNNSLAAQGLEGTVLYVGAFEGAMHNTFLAASLIALAAVFTSLIRGPLNNRE